MDGAGGSRAGRTTPLSTREIVAGKWLGAHFNKPGFEKYVVEYLGEVYEQFRQEAGA